jgi:creatinine amidohydrolase
MRTVRFELLRPDEILPERRRFPVVYQPIGPLEWHGPHLPYGMDALHAEAEARRVAESIGGVVMPTLYWGTERERDTKTLRDLGFKGDEWIVGMDFPRHSMKSMYTQEDIFGVVVRARLDLLVRQDYRLIVIVNGHGATNHLITLDRLAKEFSADSGARVLFITAFQPDADGTYHIGHADAVETSLMLAMYPEAVDISKLPALPTPLQNTDFGIVDGPTWGGKPTPDHTLRMEYDPRASSSVEVGKAHLQSTSKWIADQVLAAAAELGLTAKSGTAGD